VLNLHPNAQLFLGSGVQDLSCAIALSAYKINLVFLSIDKFPLDKDELLFSEEINCSEKAENGNKDERGKNAPTLKRAGANCRCCFY